MTIVVANPNNTALLFPLEDGMEVLYPEGGFALNFARGLGIIFCWMALHGGAGSDGGEFSFVSGGDIFFAGDADGGFVERHAGG